MFIQLTALFIVHESDRGDIPTEAAALPHASGYPARDGTELFLDKRTNQGTGN